LQPLSVDHVWRVVSGPHLAELGWCPLPVKLVWCPSLTGWSGIPSGRPAERACLAGSVWRPRLGAGAGGSGSVAVGCRGFGGRGYDRIGQRESVAHCHYRRRAGRLRGRLGCCPAWCQGDGHRRQRPRRGLCAGGLRPFQDADRDLKHDGRPRRHARPGHQIQQHRHTSPSRCTGLSRHTSPSR
jgi:hypothetical protein